MEKRVLLQMTADIVASHASMTELTSEALLAEINQVYSRLVSLAGGIEVEEIEVAAVAPGVAEIKPAVPLAAAFGADKVFCMVCGKGMKTLKRHLTTAHDLKPGAYRKKFGIPAGTPLVAKEYSEARRKMAKDLDLGKGLAKARAARAKKKKK